MDFIQFFHNKPIKYIGPPHSQLNSYMTYTVKYVHVRRYELFIHINEVDGGPWKSEYFTAA